MFPQRQIESASMLTALYCVTMIQAEIHQLFQKKITKCCGYLPIWSRSSKSNLLFPVRFWSGVVLDCIDS